MKLKSEEWERTVLDRGDGASRRDGQRDKVRACVLNLIAVTHPDDRVVRHVAEKRFAGIEDLTFGTAELARGRGLDHSSQDFSRQLHSVADPQDRNAHPKERSVAMGSARLIHAHRPT